MKFKSYVSAAARTREYPEIYDVLYPAMGLSGESGEVMEIIKKQIRRGGYLPGIDPDLSDEVRDALIDEMGDVLWYLAMLARDLGCSLELVASRNLRKLAERQDKGQIKDHG